MENYIIPDKLPGFAKKHAKLYLENGTAGHLWDASRTGGTGLMKSLLLFTRGRKSGDTLVIPLIYGQRGADYIVIASKGGFPSHPSWYLNLKANPEIDIKVAENRLRVRARDAEGEEREELWRQMVDLFPLYQDYKDKTERQIPVVVLEPI